MKREGKRQISYFHTFAYFAFSTIFVGGDIHYNKRVKKKIRSLFYPQSKRQSTCSLEILLRNPLPLKTTLKQDPLKSCLSSLFEDFSWCYFTQDTQKVFRIPLAVQQTELVLWDLRFTMVCGPMMAGKSVL